jgi:hypothetical protein
LKIQRTQPNFLQFVQARNLERLSISFRFRDVHLLSEATMGHFIECLAAGVSQEKLRHLVIRVIHPRRVDSTELCRASILAPLLGLSHMTSVNLDIQSNSAMRKLNRSPRPGPISNISYSA